MNAAAPMAASPFDDEPTNPESVSTTTNHNDPAPRRRQKDKTMKPKIQTTQTNVDSATPPVDPLEAIDGEAADRVSASASTRPTSSPAGARPQYLTADGDIVLDSIKIRQDHAIGATKKIISIVTVEKPGRQGFVYVLPDPEWRQDCYILEFKAEQKRPYLVVPSIAEQILELGVKAVALVTYVDRAGDARLWPVTLPNGDRSNTWLESALQAVTEHAGKWINVAANMSLGAYQLREPVKPFAPPAPPPVPLAKLIGLAFRDRIIDRMDHPVLQQLRGEI